MMKQVTLFFALATIIAGCGTLHSNTSIQPHDSFVLGNNEHGGFKVKLKNVSKKEVGVYMAPVAGGRYSFQTIEPGRSVLVKVARNTALVVENKSADTASVDLKVTGDTGLSMGYSGKQ